MLNKKKLLFCFIISLSTVFFLTSSDFKIHAAGKAAIVMDVETGRILYGSNIHERLPMASTTKIMTGLLAVENVPLDKAVTVHHKAVGIEGSSIYLKSNEKIKMADLVYGLMLRSGNDSAVAIAYEAGGSPEGFTAMMNARATELGAVNTNFTNPHGLHNEQHYTTAYDLAVITQEALRNPIFRKVVKTKYYAADRDDYRDFVNKNKILSILEGGDGVKTGYTRKAGRCLVASATRNNMQFIAVTLNDGNWFNTASYLLDEGFNRYKPYTLFEKDKRIKTVNVNNSPVETTYLTADKTAVIPLKEGEEQDIQSVVKLPESITAPVTKGEILGKVSVYLNGQFINSAYLTAEEDIRKFTVKEKILNFFRFPARQMGTFLTDKWGRS